MKELKFSAEEKFIGKRLDIFLQSMLEEMSRAGVQKLIEDGLVKVNGKDIKKAGTKLKGNEIVEVKIPEEEVPELKPENIPIDIVYEDEYIAVINKTSNMTVHPAQNIYTGTLVNALLYHFKSLSNINEDNIRPGIVHRLDKDTSGLIIIAKTNEAHEKLVEMFQSKNMKKTYIAICKGNFSQKSGRIENLIGRDPYERKRMAVVEINGKPAITNYEVIDEVQDFSLMKVNIETGRTHQIRVHMKFLNHPILGDSTYGSPSKLAERQMLHAYMLEFIHPVTKESIKVKGKLPGDFENIIKKLRFNREKITEIGEK
ncbi:RluA family pseudouridine synthase [Fusobacterium perfoetens]|uniref:RluA family pseudouridine synthase n=1 Tax=Fusobacterium perfoetens TaxID=852 RepID=UPI001F43B255|nr:RluA family pseudouridine synthase [Fusobacterium perfoetens]MCF2625700.1 RluA family pseudouridine synthase [Fusobacterium perfoetens]